MKYDIILRIGLLLRHDFSQEFPELFTGEEFNQKVANRFKANTSYNQNIDDHHWKDKYLELLEVRNEALNNLTLQTLR